MNTSINTLYPGTWDIISGYRGSISHGMYVPKNEPNCIDDKDTMHVCVPPIDYYLGTKQYGSRGTKEIAEGEWDIVVYEFKKYISLLAKGNPNVISLLWLDETMYLKRTTEGHLLISERDIFNSKQIYHSFIGYSYGQLHRMTHMAFRGYMGEKRKSLVEKFGYDTKNAAHLIRLMCMCIEFLNEHKFYVLRHDNQQLLEIKRGEWDLEKVKEEADRLFKRAEVAYDKCSLPSQADEELINKLSIKILQDRLRFYETCIRGELWA